MNNRMSWGAMGSYRTKDYCEHIIKVIDNEENYRPGVVGTPGNTMIDVQRRQVDVIPLSFKDDTIQSLKNDIHETITNLNLEKAGFHISMIREMQFLRYRGSDNPSDQSYYDWHHDVEWNCWHDRKLTFILQLSDPQDYEGGELELYQQDIVPEYKNQGSLIVFNSLLYHRILPVTRGYRYSIVGWMCGDPWK